MTKNKKIILAVTLPICVVLLAVTVYLSILGITSLQSYLTHKDWTALDYCNERWDIDFPDDAKVEQHVSVRGGFVNDGEIYTSCSVDALNDNFKEMFSDDTKGNSFVKFNEIINMMQEHASVIGKEIDTQSLKVPNENCVWYMRKKAMDTIVMAYDNQNNMLYIIESLM